MAYQAHDQVTDRNLTLFNNIDAIGGHILGESDNLGDLSYEGINNAGIELFIDGTIKIKVINKLEVVI